MKGFRWYLTIGSLLIIGYLVAQYFKPQPTNWTPTYLSKDKIPFGTYLLRQRINDIFPGVKVKMAHSLVYNNLKEKPAGQSNYLIIASRLKVDKLDYQEMVKYMQGGNHIFLAAFSIEGLLLDTLKLRVSSDYAFQSRRKYPINFVNKNLLRPIDFYFDKGIGDQYFSKVDTTRAIVLGEKQGLKPNFLQYKFGKGALFILPNPQLLTNYSLLKTDGLEYASKALSYLPAAENLIWDEHFAVPNTGDRSILRVLFKYDQLRWAYYISLIALLTFVAYEVKRRQRVIPIMERPKNTTVAFVEVVGRVYYQQRNNFDIAGKKVIYFLDYIRNKYRVKAATADEELKATLIRISGVNSTTIEALFDQIASLHSGQIVSDQQLITLNKLIEEFYRQDQ